MPYKLRKIRGKDLYKVVNSETGDVKSKGSTKKDAQAQLRLLRGLEKKGGSLQADQIQKVLENTYKETDDAPDGYTLDKDLSDDRAKVYKDMNSDQVIVAHRGSKGWRDWLDNARYAYSGDIKTSGTYQDAKARQQKAIDKYGAKNIISVGHSRAGKYVEELNKEQPVKEVITYNKAVHPNTIFQSNPENQTDIRTSTDLVSALSPLQFSQNKTVTIPGGYDLLKAHKPSALSYLGNKLIGKGYKQMRVADMRKFIKAYKKEKYGEKMTGGASLGKKELVSMMTPILEDDDLDEMVGGSVWTDFVKEFSARHSLKYACSLSKWKEPLKKAYKLKKEGKEWYEPFKTTKEIGVGTYRPPYQAAAEPDDLPYQPPETSPTQEMPYKPKMTRELRFQMEKALREGTKHLPPLRSKREDELIAQQVPALKGILKGLKEKTTGLKRQDMIDLILKREGLVKGAVFDDYNDYKQLEEQYKIRRDSSFLLDGLTLTNVRVLLSKLRDDLKKAKQAGDARKIGNTKTDIDRYTEELKILERLTKNDQYLIKKYNKLKGSGMEGGNRWTDFVKDYATRDKTTYGCALSDAGTSKAYKLFKDGKEWWFPKSMEIETQTEEFVEPVPTPAPTNIDPVVSRINEKVRELEKAGREKGMVMYSGDVLMLNLAFVNLMKKYGSKCVIIDANRPMGRSSNVGVELNIEPELTIIDPKRLGEKLKKCLDKGADLILIPLGLEIGESNIGHANMLVYRPSQRLVERFEPHGGVFSENDWLDKPVNEQLKQLFEVDLKPYIGDVQFREPITICPSKDGFQNLESSIGKMYRSTLTKAQLKAYNKADTEGGGFCGMWSLFLAEMTLLNPTKSTKEIIDEVMEITKREPVYIQSVIRGYVLEIEKQLDEVLKQIGEKGFKYGEKRVNILKLGPALSVWFLDNMFEPQDPNLVQSYKEKLKFLTKKEVNEIYHIYSLSYCNKKPAICIDILVDMLSKGLLYNKGATGLKDLDVILREKLYDAKKRNINNSMRWKYSVAGLAKRGYFIDPEKFKQTDWDETY